MRIVHAPPSLVAVLHLAVLFISVSGRVSSNTSFTPERIRHSGNTTIQWSHNLTLRDKQLFISQQSAASSAVECCPSELEMTEPHSGRSEMGVLVKLYRDANNHQRFYEISCKKGVENKECRFLDKKLANQSKCVQQYSYSYALLEDNSGLGEGAAASASFPITGTTGQTRWMLGYIRVRSGCACTLSPKITKKSQKTKKKFHHNDGLT